MAQYKKPKHCNGCVYFHSAGHVNPKPPLVKYNFWCPHYGKPAVKAESQCKLEGGKKTKADADPS